MKKYNLPPRTGASTALLLFSAAISLLLLFLFREVGCVSVEGGGEVKRERTKSSLPASVIDHPDIFI